MIAIKKEKLKSGKIKYSLLVNGKILKNVSVSENYGGSTFDITVQDTISTQLIDAFSFATLTNSQINQIELKYNTIYDGLFEFTNKELTSLKKNSSFFYYAYLYTIVNVDLEKLRENEPCIEIRSKIPLAMFHWKKPYSFKQYADNFTKKVEEFFGDEIFAGGFGAFEFSPTSKESSLREEITKKLELIKEIHKKVLSILDSSIIKNSVTISMNNFPPDLRVACKQYLQYFEEFLRDLGIDATSDLKHEAGKVLFTVTPDDKKVSLDKIRTALEVYLELPKSPLIDSENSDNGIREIKYIQEVNTLKMKLSQAEMKVHYEKQLVAEKERTIQALSIFTKSIIEEKISVSSKEITKEKKKKLLKGTVEVGKLKVLEGLEFDLPKILENTKLDAVFDQLEEFLNNEQIIQLKLNEPSE